MKSIRYLFVKIIDFIYRLNNFGGYIITIDFQRKENKYFSKLIYIKKKLYLKKMKSTKYPLFIYKDNRIHLSIE